VSLFLLIPQCLNRIQSRSSARWIIAENDTDSSRDAEGEQYRRSRNRSLKDAEIGYAVCDEPTEDDADGAADDGESDCFDEELGADVFAFSANGFTETDFAGTFSDGGEHHIHDTDTANDE